ncbi:MAG: ECF transporter S component [Lachnospiraceae bacterium]|jgi:hypothetical protein|nr:ECF transporter S component [Lachnospiraceae bacterium]
MKQIKTRQLVQTALLLSLCLMGQLFRQFGQYFTGTITNTTIILAVLAVGLSGGLLIGTVAPFTAILISPNPIINAVPMILPALILGNAVIAVLVWRFRSSSGWRMGLGLILSSVIKAAFLGSVTGWIILPLFGAPLPAPAMTMAKAAFSTTQLLTALTGSLLAFLIWIPLKKYLVKN